MKLNVELGRENMGGAMCPEGANDKKWYPSFTYEGKEDLDLPKEGTMVIRFKKVATTESENESGERYTCTVEVQEIISVDGGKINAPAKSFARETEDALDKLASEQEED